MKKTYLLLFLLMLLKTGFCQTPYLGEIRWFAFNVIPNGYLPCDGRTLPINQNQALYALLGNTYGGNGTTTFGIPNLQGRCVIHYSGDYPIGTMGGEVNHILTNQEMPGHHHTYSNISIQAFNENPSLSAPGGNIPAYKVPRGNAYSNVSNEWSGIMYTDNSSNTGGGLSHPNMKPYLVLQPCIAVTGIFPSQYKGDDPKGDCPYLAEIYTFAFNFAPNSHSKCEGQLMAIIYNTALFALLGTNYGGNGQNNYGLPDLKGRMSIGFGQGNGLTNRTIGEWGGIHAVTLLTTEIPSHTHNFSSKLLASSTGTGISPVNCFPAFCNYDLYSSSSNCSLGGNYTQYSGISGSSYPHNNMMPYIALNQCITLSGAFPPYTKEGGSKNGTTTFIGELSQFAFNFAPMGYALCNGQWISISENEVLFNLIGTTYGGDGAEYFALPDLRGRTLLGAGNGYNLGQTGGDETETLILNQLPTHSHSNSFKIPVYQGAGNTSNPAGNYPAFFPGKKAYGSTGDVNMADGSLSADLAAQGNGNAHENMQPFLSMNFCIALYGIYPSSKDQGTEVKMKDRYTVYNPATGEKTVMVAKNGIMVPENTNK